MATSSSNTIDTVNTLAEALKYASSLVDTTQGTIDTSFSFMSSYDYYGTIGLNPPAGTEISVPFVEIENPDSSKFFTYDEAVMANSFYTIGAVAASGNNVIEEMDTVPIAVQMLTADTLRDYSIKKDGVISLPTAYYAAGVVFDPANDDDDTVLSAGMAESMFYKTGVNIPISDIDWDVFVRVGGGTISSPAGKGYFTLNGLSIVNSIEVDNVTTTSASRTFTEVLAPYVGPDNLLDDNARIPEEKMSQDFNILTGRKIRDKQFKAGSTVSLNIAVPYTDAELKAMVDAEMTSSGFSAVFSGIDAMLTQAQVVMITEYILTKVMSIDDSGLQV